MGRALRQDVAAPYRILDIEINCQLNNPVTVRNVKRARAQFVSHCEMRQILLVKCE
jgi:hypothetical protein